MKKTQHTETAQEIGTIMVRNVDLKQYAVARKLGRAKKKKINAGELIDEAVKLWIEKERVK